MDDFVAAPHCVICGHSGRGEAAAFHMTHGIVVWLCPAHRQPRFLRRKRGRVFAERLHRAWISAGRATRRHLAALAAHQRRVTPEPAARERPGSYAWPKLRRTAEERFAAGEDPDTVIRELRALYQYHAANVPSVRTMRRWHQEARWIENPDAAPVSQQAWLKKPAWLRRPRVSRWPNLGYDTSLAIHPLGWFLLLWVDDRDPTTHWRRR